MPLLLAAKVWHYWISVFLVVPSVLLFIGMALLYVKKVVAPRYPRGPR